jgi:long-chain-fatty-acid--CoA ligase ACSBG
LIKLIGCNYIFHALWLCTSKGNKVDANTPWKTWTWKEYREQVDAFGVSLIALGCAKFDVVNIIGFNAPEWFFANFGAIAAGCVPAGIYATNNSAACQYISEHSQAKVVVVEGVKQLEKYLEIAKDLPHLKAIVMYGPDALPANVKDRCTVPCYVWNDFLQVGKADDGKNNESVLKERSTSWKPGETCTLIYTSGTTGPPKAVMITNDNITWTVSTMLLITRHGFMDNNDHMISYLPLSHIAAQMLDMHMPLSTGCQIHFAQPDALQGTLGMTLKEVRPTTFFGVPRVWEKIYGTCEVHDVVVWLREARDCADEGSSVYLMQTSCRRWPKLPPGSKRNSPRGRKGNLQSTGSRKSSRRRQQAINHFCWVSPTNCFTRRT